MCNKSRTNAHLFCHLTHKIFPVPQHHPLKNLKSCKRGAMFRNSVGKGNQEPNRWGKGAFDIHSAPSIVGRTFEASPVSVACWPGRLDVAGGVERRGEERSAVAWARQELFSDLRGTSPLFSLKSLESSYSSTGCQAAEKKAHRSAIQIFLERKMADKHLKDGKNWEWDEQNWLSWLSATQTQLRRTSCRVEGLEREHKKQL